VNASPPGSRSCDCHGARAALNPASTNFGADVRVWLPIAIRRASCDRVVPETLPEALLPKNLRVASAFERRMIGPVAVLDAMRTYCRIRYAAMPKGSTCASPSSRRGILPTR